MNQATPELVAKWLSHSSPSKRVLGVRNVRAVTRDSKEAVHRLVKAFRDSSTEVKRAVVDELRRYGGQVSLRALMACGELSDTSGVITMQEAVEASLDDASSEILVESLRSKSRYTRQLAAHAISKRPDAKFLPPLLDVLKATREDRFADQEIFLAVAAIHDRSAVPVLAHLLQNAEVNDDVRGVLAVVISILGGGGIAPILLDELNSHACSAAYEYESEAFAFLAAELGRRGLWWNLARSLNGHHGDKMARSLEGVTDVDFGHQLVHLLAQSPSLPAQKHACRLLGNVHTAEAAHALVGVMRDGRPAHSGEDPTTRVTVADVRVEAAESVARLVDVGNATELLEAFGHLIDDIETEYKSSTTGSAYRYRAACALRNVNSPAVISLMLRLWRSEYAASAQRHREQDSDALKVTAVVKPILLERGEGCTDGLLELLESPILPSLAGHIRDILGRAGGIRAGRVLVDHYQSDFGALDQWLRRNISKIPYTLLEDISRLEDFRYLSTYSERTGEATYDVKSVEWIRAMARNEINRREASQP